MIVVFTKVAVIFFMVIVGYIACKTNVLPYESNKYLVSLLLTITTPCMIFSSLMSKTISEDTFIEAIQIIVGSIIFFFGAAFISYFIIRLLHYKPLEDRGVLMVIITAVNTAFMGFPVTKAVFGDDFLFLMVIENIVLTTYLYSLAIIQMNMADKGISSIKSIIKPLCNMCMLAVATAILLIIVGVKPPSILMDLTSSIGQATIPVSMIVVGIQLAQSDYKKALKNKALLIAALCNVLLIPFLTFLAVNWLPIAPSVKLILIYAASFPCAVVTVAVASKENKNAGLMAEGVALTTLFSMVTLPIISMILMTLYI